MIRYQKEEIMKLNVPFQIIIKTIELRKNYTGMIVLSPKGATPKGFYFLVLNPYSGSEAEFGLYEDVERRKVFAEGIGKPQQGYNPNSGLPITYFDFSLESNDPKLGVVFVLSQIISEGIYHAETSGQGIEARFTHHWEQDFDESAMHVAKSFLRFFNL
jgi:hypothetical protein